MALEIKGLKRVIEYNDNILADIPGMSIEKIKDMYSVQYPELINANIEGPKIEEEDDEDVTKYTFSKNVGTKG